MKEYIKINPADNVAVAIAPLRKGTTVTVDGSEITIVDDIPAGHKFALEPIAEGENVVKYGFPIGHVRHAVAKGAFLDHETIATNLAGTLDYSDISIKEAYGGCPARYREERTFEGYLRPEIGRAHV